MKTLLRSTLLFCLSISLGTTALAEPTPVPSTTSTPLLAGTWSATVSGENIIFIFNNAGDINLVESKTYGDYKHYEFPDARYSNLLSQIAQGKFVVESALKYKVQGNLLEVTSVGGRIHKNRLDFTNNGRTLSFSEEKDSKPLLTVQRISDSTELPKETESLATVQGHFYGLQKLISLQTAQTDYWAKKRRFANQLQSLKIKPLPESDRSYRG
jgi:hypothetical protein